MKVPNRMLPWLFALLQMLVPVSSAPPKTTPYQLPQLSEDGSTIARVLNGIALGHSLSDGTADPDLIVSELLNLGRGETLNLLVAKNVDGLGTDLGKITGAVEKACGTTGECVKKAVVDEGAAVLQAHQHKGLGIALKEGSQLLKLVDLKDLYARLTPSYTLQAILIDHIGTIDQVPTNDENGANTFVNNFQFGMNPIVKTQSLFDSVVSNVSEIQKDKASEEVDALLGLKPFSDPSSDLLSKVTSMNMELATVKGKSNDLSAVLSRDSLSDLDQRIEILQNVITPKGFDEKVFTGGFFNGVKDLDGLKKDSESPIVTTILGKGQSVEKVKSGLDSVVQFGKDIKQLKTKWDSLKFTGGIVQKMDSVREVLRMAEKDVTDGLSVYLPLHECTKGLKAAGSFDFTKLEMLKSDLSTVMDDVTRISNELQKHKGVFAGLSAIKTIIDSKQTGTKKLQELKTLLNANNLKKSLQEYETFLTNENGKWTNQVPGSLFGVQGDFLKKDLKTWLDGFGIVVAYECLSKNGGLAKAKSAKAFQALPTLTSQNTDLASVQSASSLLKAPIDEWKKLKTSLSTGRKTRGIKDGPGVKELMKASQEFSGGIAVIRGSAAALSSGDNVKKLLNADSTIEAEIMKLNDKKMEKEIRKEWNKDSKDALKRLPDAVQEMSKLVQKKPEQLSDFDEFFKKAQKVTFGDVDCYVLSATLGSFKNPADLGGILKSLEHVRFNKAADKLKFASGSIQPLQKYLDSVLGVVPKKPQLQKAPPSNQTADTSNGDEESSNLVLYIVLVIVFVLLIIIAVVCYFKKDWIKSKMQKKKEDKDSVNVEEGEVKASKTSGSKDAAKLKKGTGKTATTESRTESKVDETKTAPAQQFSSKAFKEELASRKERKAIREAKITENVVIVDGNVVVADDEEKTLKYPKKEPIKPNFVAVTKLTAAQKKEHDEIKNDIRKDRKRATQLAEMTGNKFSHVEMYAEGISFDQLTENLSKVDQKPATIEQKKKKPVVLKKLHVVFQKDCDIVKKPETVNVAKPSLDSSAAQNRTRTQVTQDSVEETAPETAQLPEIKAVPSTVSTQQSTRSSGGGESSDSSDDSDDSEYDDEAPDEKCRLIDSDDKLARQPKFTYIRHENFEQKYARLIAGQPSQTLDEFYGKTVVDRELAGGDEKQLNHEIRKKARKVFWHRKALRDCVGPFKEVWEDFLETEDFHPEKWLKVFTSEFRGHGPYRHETHRPNGQLHPMPLQIVRMILKEARDAFKKDPAFLRLNGTVQVFGDLHGYFHDTVRQCHIGGFMTNTWLFLGDYVDRGAQGIDVVLFLCLCKLVSPDTVFLLRGNHEFEEMNKHYGFLDECKGAFGDNRGLVVFCDINTVFNQLSVCATINDKIFCVHGGISKELESGPDALEMIKKVPETDKEKRLHQNLLWSDLVYGKGSYPQSTRSPEPEMRNFTIGALRKVLKVQDWSYVLHGHNVKPEGYEENFRVILTIYSAPNTRCNPDDLSNNCGAFVIVGTDFVIRIVQFENWDTRVEGRVNTGAVTKIAELPE